MRGNWLIAFLLSGEIRIYKTGEGGREITLYEIGSLLIFAPELDAQETLLRESVSPSENTAHASSKP